MGDTCATARLTKKLLAERVAACVEESLGDQWSELDEDEQKAT